MNIAGIDYESVKEADGMSCVIYCSGCYHSCEGCHSPQTHDFNYGIKIDEGLISTINKEIDKRPYLNALVLCGGDPMYSAKELIDIIPQLHIPNDNLWCYSGFTFEEIQQDEDMSKLLDMCNVLIDGKFVLEKRDITLQFRGSSNQHIWRKRNGIWRKEE